LVWEIKSYIQGSGSDATQPYNFSLSDSIENLTSGNFAEDDYEFVGYKLSGEKYYSDKTTQENLTAEGYRYDYVLTKHKKETFKSIDHKLKNTITAKVDPYDQVDNDTTATSSKNL